MIARFFTNHKVRGQSLVETALFLPILLILIGGVVEISNILVTQNKVTTAARAATGFGAANYQGDDWNDAQTWATGMANVATNNVTNTLDLDPDVWDIYTVKATLNPAATAFEEWQSEHAYGSQLVTPAGEWSTMEEQIKEDVIEALDSSQTGVEVVATVTFHNRDSILGLGAFNVGELTRVRGLSVMRVSDPTPYGGCDAFPIAVSLYNNSVWPNGHPNIPPGDEEFPFESGDNPGGNGYHWKDRGGKKGGAPPPVYEEGNTKQFPLNVSGVPITQAQPGYLYLTKQSGENGSGGFGWLRWSEQKGTPTLIESLTYPGNAHTYNYPPWSDDGLNPMDIVRVETGAVSAASDIMKTHIDVEGRTLKLPVFTPTTIRNGDWNGDGYATGGGGNNYEYEIYGFVVVKMIAWYLPGNHNWLLFEFVRWDDNC